MAKFSHTGSRHNARKRETNGFFPATDYDVPLFTGDDVFLHSGSSVHAQTQKIIRHTFRFNWQFKNGDTNLKIIFL